MCLTDAIHKLQHFNQETHQYILHNNDDTNILKKIINKLINKKSGLSSTSATLMSRVQK